MAPLTILLTPDESGGFTVRVPDLPGCITHGDTIDLALANAREAIALYLAGQSPERLRAAGVRPEVVATLRAAMVPA